MRVIRSGALAVLLTLALAACAASTSGQGPSTEPTSAEGATDPTEALVGNYSVTYRTTESDFQPITDETIVRGVEVSGSCTETECDLVFTTELKTPDGSTASGTTALTFDGTAYHGTQSAMFSCDGMSSLTTVENGLEYTSDTTITASETSVEDGRSVVTAFDVVTVERNEITEAGREAGCLAINFSGPDPNVANATTVGVGTRQP